MIKTVIAAAFATVSLVAVSMPAQADTKAAAACDVSYSAADNETAITQLLGQKGLKVAGVDEWNGCVRAYVTQADGSVGMAYFDPLTLNQVGGPISNS